MPEVPVRVTGKVPAAAALVAVKVNVEVPVTLAGLSVTPAGKPDADKAIVPAKLPDGVTVSVLVPVPPAVTVAPVAERLKSGVVIAAAGVSVYIAV